MNYEGKLYGKVGKVYFQLEYTTEDVDKLQVEIVRLNHRLDKLPNQLFYDQSLRELPTEEEIENEALRRRTTNTGFQYLHDVKWFKAGANFVKSKIENK